MSLIGYARCSTIDQNLDMQMDALKAAGCARVFCEHASGGDRKRPELAAAMAFCRSGDTFVFWKLDRVARSLLHLIEICDALKARGVAFRSLTDPIDTGTAMGTMVFQVMGAIAEFEKNLGRERTMAGLASARERGRIGGRPKGYSPSPRLDQNEKRLLTPRVPAFCDD